MLTLVTGFAAGAETGEQGSKTLLDLAASPIGIVSLAAFAIAYLLVMLEEFLHLRKSKPMLVASGLIWALIAWAYHGAGDPETPAVLVRHYLLEYSELFLFLLAAMTFINTMEERGLFDALRVWLIGRGWSLRKVFWATGALAFFISPVADNLTTALLMGTVVTSVGRGRPRFVLLALINIVVAANAGGAFSPFGDITTLMVWQKHLVDFHEFFDLFVPALVNWAVPAVCMTFAIGDGHPQPVTDRMRLQPGAFFVAGLFLFTIAMAVLFHTWLHMPPVIGMMTGLGFLKLYGYYLYRLSVREARERGMAMHTLESGNPFEAFSHEGARFELYDIFKRLEKAEWDTLIFFY
ncbi:MAG: sodium:proton antiporter, partial [Planctomycetota bacterium]